MEKSEAIRDAIICLCMEKCDCGETIDQLFEIYYEFKQEEKNQ